MSITTKPILIIISGESNSGGRGENTLATESELAVRPQVQILHNLTFQFEDLDIGTNNIVDHDGANDDWRLNRHGWELQLANRVNAGDLPNPVYLVKTGQGGSRIDQWVEGSGYWTKMQERVDDAISLITTATGQAPELVLWFSLGINDALNATPVNDWKAAIVAHFAKIRAQWGNMPILATKFESITGADMNPFNVAIGEIAAENTGIYAISSTDAALDDANHWNYYGAKLIADRLINQSIILLQAIPEEPEEPETPAAFLIIYSKRSLLFMPDLPEDPDPVRQYVRYVEGTLIEVHAANEWEGVMAEGIGYGITNLKIAAGTAGWYGCLVGTNSDAALIGLDRNNELENYNTMDYCINPDGPTTGGKYYTYVQGVPLLSTVTVMVGDFIRFRIVPNGNGTSTVLAEVSRSDTPDDFILVHTFPELATTDLFLKGAVAYGTKMIIYPEALNAVPV